VTVWLDSVIRYPLGFPTLPQAAYFIPMEIISFSIEGYRRFVNRSSVKLHGKMIAFVGPNEAGKTSILNAMSRVNINGTFERTEYARRQTVEPRLAWVLQLDETEKTALTGISDSDQIEALNLVRYGDGRDTWEFRPKNPQRPRTYRATALASLKSLRSSDGLARAQADEEQDFNFGEYDHVIDVLETDSADISGSDLTSILSLSSRLQLVRYPEPDESDEETSNEDEFLIDQLAVLLKHLGDEEGDDSPFVQCWRRLQDRLPTVRFFGSEDRDLATSYDLAQAADNPPAALANLAKLAQLDLTALRDEASASHLADLATRRDSANQRLRQIFSESWNQEEVAVQIEVQGTLLRILATTPKDNGLSDIEERSEGMRWFAALVAFCHALADRPVILVDELETHLHYDAQADLIDVLSAQNFASKVIYTTHSFGCLPHDLGTGVRVVEPVDVGTSKLENGFWHRGAGFQPLLASMGAAAMSFTPTRRAVVAEGPADAILLPSVLRDALGVSRLSFQVAPGLSIVASAKMSELDSEAGRVAYIVDGDQGGRELVENLRLAGVSDDRIVKLVNGTTELELEDLIDPELYVAAVNAELKLWNGAGSAVLATTDLTPSLRSKGLREWCATNSCSEPDKRAVAQRVADQSGERSIINSSLRDFLQNVGGQLLKIFEES
jgi:hypothetical protein